MSQLFGEKLLRWNLGHGEVHEIRRIQRSDTMPVSNDRLLATENYGSIQLWEMATGEPQGSVVFCPTAADEAFVFSPSGHHLAWPKSRAAKLLYVVKTDDGKQLTLSADEFTKRFGWKNDPARVNVAGQAAD